MELHATVPRELLESGKPFRLVTEEGIEIIVVGQQAFPLDPETGKVNCATETVEHPDGSRDVTVFAPALGVAIANPAPGGE